MCKYIFSLLFVVAAMLLATPGAEARFYIDIPGVETNCIPANTPLTIEVKMDNNTGENVIGLANGFLLYSPDGAVWETPVYYSTGNLEPYLDGGVFVNGLGVDGIGEDTITLGGYASLEPGVPNGYNDVVLKIETQFDAAQIGKTFCIDSTWFPPGGSWQWVTPSGTVIPEWDGPHCYEVVTALATIEGAVFYDVNGNGVWDQLTETGMPGVPVNLVGTATQSITTDINGEYSFIFLAGGTYRVYEDVPSGYVQTFPTSVVYKFVTTGYAQYTNVDFGNTDTTCETEITTDTCFAGTYDDFVGPEPSSPDPELLALMGTASSGANPYFDSACSNQSFGHTFSDCWPESCKVVGATLCMRLKATGPIPSTDKLYLGEWDGIGAFWAITMNNLETYAGSNGGWQPGDIMTVCLDLADLPAAGVGGPQNLLGGLQDGRLDVLISDDTEVDYLELIVETCCEVPPLATIEGAVFYDDDGDGVRDQPWDTSMSGVTVHLIGADTMEVTTDSDGEYCFSGLAAGTYRVFEDVPSGYVQTFPTSVVYKFVMTGYADHTNVDFLNADTTCTGTIEFDTCFAGTDDDFVGAEPSSPDAALLAIMGNASSGANPYFDSACVNQSFGHTFSCWPESCMVVGATLCMKLKATGTYSPTDKLYLGEWDSIGAFWAINLNDLEDFAGGNGPWILGDVMTVCLDLADMPAAGMGGPQNLLGGLQDGRLDVLISDDTEVDYLELIVEICCGAIPSHPVVIVEPSNGGEGGTLYSDEPVTFDIILRNYSENIIRAITNGFLLYSPDGATWETPVYYSTGALEPYFDGGVFVNGLGVDGIGEDTITLGGYASLEPGIPNGFNEVVVKIETEFDAAQEGKTFCIDSTFFPPSGYWLWAYTGGSLIPDWGGPYCWEIIEPDTCYADGDVNNDGIAPSVTDLVDLIVFLNGEGPAPVPPYSADLNGDGIIDGKDVQMYKNYFIYGMSVFTNGYPVPCPCDPILAPAAVYLESMTGGGSRGNDPEVLAEEPFIFNIALRNNTGSDLKGFTHGFKVYSPDGATWEPLVYDTTGGLDDYFDLGVWLNEFSNDGNGADTVGVAANVATLPGIPNGYDDVVLMVGTMVNESQVGKTICIDSCWYPPVNSWQWVIPEATIHPVWDGPHCFEIIEFPWDTVYSYDARFTSLRSGALTLNPDSSVTVSGMGSTGRDGVAMYFAPSRGVGTTVGGAASMPVGSYLGAGGFGGPSLPDDDIDDLMWGCCVYPDRCETVRGGYCGGYFAEGLVCVPYWLLLGTGCAMEWQLWLAELDWLDQWLEPITGGGLNEDLLVVSVGIRELQGSLEVMLAVDVPETPYTLEVYSGGILTFSTTNQVGQPIVTSNVTPDSLAFGGAMGVSWPQEVSITIPGGPTISGDQIRAVPLGRPESASLISLVHIQTSRIPEFTIAGVNLTSCCVDDRGNVDGDPEDIIDISDLVYLVDYMFTGGAPPPCWEEANVDGNGPDDNSGIDISDLVYLVDYMFNQGPAPVPCGYTPPPAKVGGQQADISFDVEYANDISTVVMNTPIDLRGIQLELKGTGPAPANLVGDHVDMIQGRDGWVVKVGLLDLNGGEIISADTREVVRFEGKYTLEAVIVADVDARSITPTIGIALKQNELPTVYTLSQNYPNPFNPSTSISFALPEAAEVRLEVFNLLGQRVTTLLNQRLEAGNHTAEWNSQNELGQTVASGIYFYRLETPRFTESKKMVLLK